MNEIPSLETLILQTHADVTDDVIFSYSLTHKKLLYINAACHQIWNLSSERAMANPLLLIEVIEPEDRQLAADRMTELKEKEKQRIDLRLQLPGQPQKWIEIQAALSMLQNEEIIVGTVTDITAVKEYSNTLHKFANKKNSILEILSHDLVSPLANIQMCAKLLGQHTAKENDGVVNRMLALITDNSTRSVKMIRDLVNKELLESSEAPLILQRTDLIKRIREVMEQYKHSYGTIKQNMQLVSKADHLFMTIDETKFMQVINNLLSNALKFTRDEDEILVIVEEKEDRVFIQVKDTGIGIPADIQPFIFDRFTKARREGIHGEPTTGLGLSIIKTIVEWHNGRIWFQSKDNEGTTFFIELPKDRL